MTLVNHAKKMEIFRGELRGRGRGGWRGGRQEDRYPPPGLPRYHEEDRYYDQRPPPPRYYDRGTSTEMRLLFNI